MTIDEMRAELEKTWYTAFVVTDPEYPAVYIPCVHTPDGLEIRGKSQGFTGYDACKEVAIKMAYGLLQKENEFKAMKAFIQKLANSKVKAIEWEETMLGFQAEAKKLIED
jgi:hypothetical protein